MVEAEIVDKDEEHLLALVEKREHRRFEDFVAHQRVVVAAHPVVVVALHPFGEGRVGLRFLHLDQFIHISIGGGKLQFPIHDSSVEFGPVVESAAVIDLSGDSPEFLAVVGGGLIGHKFFGVQILLNGEENLVGVNRLNEIVGDFIADSLVHDVFLFAFRDHDHRHSRCDLLHLRKRFEARQSGHILVEDNHVKVLAFGERKRVAAVVGCNHIVAFAFKEKDMRL